MPSQSSRSSTTSASPVASGRLPDATGQWPVLPLIESCRAVSQRAAQTLKIGVRDEILLEIALDHLTLGRAALYAAIFGAPVSDPASASSSQRAGPEVGAPDALQTARHELDAAVAGFRRAGQQNYLPLGLLTRAWLRFLIGARTGPESSQEDLDEAWVIAERGPMKLFLADIHLTRARLFGSPTSKVQSPTYPWESPEADLKAAEKLIHTCGYHRRDEELANAKQAILSRRGLRIPHPVGPSLCAASVRLTEPGRPQDGPTRFRDKRAAWWCEPDLTSPARRAWPVAASWQQARPCALSPGGSARRPCPAPA